MCKCGHSIHAHYSKGACLAEGEGAEIFCPCGTFEYVESSAAETSPATEGSRQ
jgi:hypothetical protein